MGYSIEVSVLCLNESDDWIFAVANIEVVQNGERARGCDFEHSSKIAEGAAPSRRSVEVTIGGKHEPGGILAIGAVRMGTKVVERRHYAARSDLEERALAIGSAARRHPV